MKTVEQFVELLQQRASATNVAVLSRLKHLSAADVPRLEAEIAALFGDVGLVRQLQAELQATFDRDETLKMHEATAARFHAMRRAHPLDFVRHDLATGLSSLHDERVVRTPLALMQRHRSINGTLLTHRSAEHYLLVRVVAPSTLLAQSVCAVLVEDAERRVFPFILGDGPFVRQIDADAVFFVGAVFAVKNALVELPAVHRRLRCQNWANCVAVNRGDALLRDTPWFVAPCDTAAAWEARGDALFAGNHMLDAVLCFSEGVKLGGALRAKRAAAYRALGEWQLSLDDAVAVLADDGASAACAHYRAEALSKLGRHTEAVGAWLAAAKLCVLASPERVRAQAQATAAHVCAQQATGVFDWQRLWASDRFECATFLDSRVQVAQTRHGRGLVCSAPIAAGSLILVESALVTALTDADYYTRHGNLATALTLKLCADATFARLVGSLSTDGTAALGVEEDEMSFCFRVRAVCTTNCWSCEFEKTLGKPPRHDIAIYHTASLFNHSCAPNCTVVHVSGTAIVQANRDIDAGEELSQRYIDVTLTYAERTAALKNRSFACDCVRCVREQKSPLVPQPKFSARPDLANDLDRFSNVVHAIAAINEGRIEDAKAWLCVSLPQPLAALCVEAWRKQSDKSNKV
jgi:tetratricopeptide (TPR) repeat protein